MENSAIVQRVICRVRKVRCPYYAGYESPYINPKSAKRNSRQNLPINLLLTFELLATGFLILEGGFGNTFKHIHFYKKDKCV